MKGGELIKELKQVKPGNVEQLLRRLKVSVPLNKLLKLSQEMKEYLLDCLVHSHTASRSQIVLPPWIHCRDITTEDYANYRTSLAKTIPKQPYRVYIPWTYHPALGKKLRIAGKG